MEDSYRHTQIGILTLATILSSLALIAVLGMQTGWDVVLFVVAVILLLCGLVFSSLTVEIRDGVLECRFCTGLIHKRFALQDIVDARAVRNRWYYGWGIRWVPGGWLWNVSGLDAVELSLTSGRIFRIGTDEPEELTAALKRAIT